MPIPHFNTSEFFIDKHIDDDDDNEAILDDNDEDDYDIQDYPWRFDSTDDDDIEDDPWRYDPPDGDVIQDDPRCFESCSDWDFIQDDPRCYGTTSVTDPPDGDVIQDDPRCYGTASRQEVNSQAPRFDTENTQNSIKTLQDLANEYNIDINQFNDTFIWYFNMMLEKYHKNGFDYEFGRYFGSEYVISYQDVLFQMKYDLMFWYGSDSLYVSIYNSTSPKLIRAYEDFNSKAFDLYDSVFRTVESGSVGDQQAFDEALEKLKQAIRDVEPNDFVRLLFCLLDMKDYENEHWGQWRGF